MSEPGRVQAWWRTDARLDALVERAIRLGSHHQPDALHAPDRRPPVFAEAVEHFHEVMRHAHREAIRGAAADVEYVVATAHQMVAARIPPYGAAGTYVDEQRGRARDRAERVRTAAEVHAADLRSIQRSATTVLARLDSELRHAHSFGSHLTYTVPAVDVPAELLEIGQTRVKNALEPGQPSLDAPTEGIA